MNLDMQGVEQVMPEPVELGVAPALIEDAVDVHVVMGLGLGWRAPERDALGARRDGELRVVPHLGRSVLSLAHGLRRVYRRIRKPATLAPNRPGVSVWAYGCSACHAPQSSRSK